MDAEGTGRLAAATSTSYETSYSPAGTASPRGRAGHTEERRRAQFTRRRSTENMVVCPGSSERYGLSTGPYALPESPTGAQNPSSVALVVLGVRDLTTTNDDTEHAIGLLEELVNVTRNTKSPESPAELTFTVNGR